VKAALKTLLIILALLALPLQGFAAAAQLWCDPAPATAMQHCAHAADGGSQPQDDAMGGWHASCCAATALIAPSHPAPLPVYPPQFESIPFVLSSWPSVDLDMPERPPRA